MIYVRIHTLSWFVLLLSTLFLLIGCQSLTIDKTKEEIQPVTIQVYSSLPSDRIETYIAQFESEYPSIKVDLTFSTEKDLTDRILADRLNPSADVIWGLPIANAHLLDWQDLLMGYEPAGLDRINPQFYDVVTPPHWVGTAARILVFCVNTELLAERDLEMPTSWSDLINPAYKGQIAVPSSTTSGSGYLLLATILQIYGEVDGWDYIANLHKNTNNKYAADVKIACQLASKGDFPIAISFDYRTTQQIELGNPIKLIFPAEGAGWDIEVNALIRKKNIKPEAKTFLDWAISDSIIALYQEDRDVLATNLTIESSSKIDFSKISSALSLLDEDVAWISANRQRILRMWAQQFESDITILK